jgi:antitoxin (DNA-binding transcriptional repressor) of toxin-antitoxin stability system
MTHVTGCSCTRRAETVWRRLLQRVMNGERFIIAKADKPVAFLSPIEPLLEPRIPGNDKGKVAVVADLDTPRLSARALDFIAKGNN